MEIILSRMKEGKYWRWCACIGRRKDAIRYATKHGYRIFVFRGRATADDLLSIRDKLTKEATDDSDGSNHG